MKKSACRVISKISSLPRSAAALFLISLSKRSEVAGFELIDTTDDDSRIATGQLLEALRLAQDTAPRVYARMQRDVRRLILLKAGSPEFWPFANAIALKKATVEAAEPSLLAMTLVHEATHARLWRVGIGYPRQARQRIEHLCVNAEVTLARNLPNASELEAIALKKLGHEWWTESAIAEMRKKAQRELSAP